MGRFRIKGKEMMEHMSEPYIVHEEFEKCGQCLREKIKSQVAKEFLDAGKFSEEHLSELFAEVDRRWFETSLYKRVKSMLDLGKSLEEIEQELEKEGISI